MNRFAIVSAILGFVFVSAGAGLIYRPLGVLAAGSLMLAAAFVSANRSKKS